MKDWTGNATSIYTTHGASNHSDTDRADFDYYATDPDAVKALLEHEEFNHYIWECACGGGHISNVLLDSGFNVRSSDIVDRGFEGTEIIDFLGVTREDVKEMIPRDIITNPPYKFAKEFVENALDLSMDSVKVARKPQNRMDMRYNKMKIYIAGAISNNPDYEKQFYEAELLLIEQGHAVINPVKNLGFEYKDYIDMGLCELMHCEAIYMLEGWRTSKGAILEHLYAVTTGMKIIEEGCEKHAMP